MCHRPFWTCSSRRRVKKKRFLITHRLQRKNTNRNSQVECEKTVINRERELTSWPSLLSLLSTRLLSTRTPCAPAPQQRSNHVKRIQKRNPKVNDNHGKPSSVASNAVSSPFQDPFTETPWIVRKKQTIQTHSKSYSFEIWEFLKYWKYWIQRKKTYDAWLISLLDGQ